MFIPTCGHPENGKHIKRDKKPLGLVTARPLGPPSPHLQTHGPNARALRSKARTRGDGLRGRSRHLPAQEQQGDQDLSKLVKHGQTV